MICRKISRRPVRSCTATVPPHRSIAPSNPKMSPARTGSFVMRSSGRSWSICDRLIVRTRTFERPARKSVRCCGKPPAAEGIKERVFKSYGIRSGSTIPHAKWALISSSFIDAPCMRTEAILGRRTHHPRTSAEGESRGRQQGHAGCESGTPIRHLHTHKRATQARRYSPGASHSSSTPPHCLVSKEGSACR